MTKWEYTACVGHIRQVSPGERSYSVLAQFIWTHKDKSGKTVWDTVQDFGKEGWELVSVTPIVESGSAGFAHTEDLLYTFKRPIEELL